LMRASLRDDQVEHDCQEHRAEHGWAFTLRRADTG
jgi:hypothetical protein